MCFSTGKLVVTLFLIISFCIASYGTQDCSSLCGDHNISIPFRLKDSPERCGEYGYELSCEKNQLFLYIEYMRFRVLSINYHNQTIRVRDISTEELDPSSLPHYSLTTHNFSSFYHYNPWYFTNIMIYIRCEHPLGSHQFLNTAPCFNTSNSSLSSSSSSNMYVYVGSRYVSYRELENGCVIEMVYITSWSVLENQSLSCADIHNILLYGFEFAWFRDFSKSIDRLNSICLCIHMLCRPY